MKTNTASVGIKYGRGDQVVHIDKDAGKQYQDYRPSILLKCDESDSNRDQEMDAVMYKFPGHLSSTACCCK